MNVSFSSRRLAGTVSALAFAGNVVMLLFDLWHSGGQYRQAITELRGDFWQILTLCLAFVGLILAKWPHRDRPVLTVGQVPWIWHAGWRRILIFPIIRVASPRDSTIAVDRYRLKFIRGDKRVSVWGEPCEDPPAFPSELAALENVKELDIRNRTAVPIDKDSFTTGYLPFHLPEVIPADIEVPGGAIQLYATDDLGQEHETRRVFTDEAPDLLRALRASARGT